MNFGMLENYNKFWNIKNAKLTCKRSKFMIDEHFTQVGKTSKMPNDGVKNILEYKLSRYACYLIIQSSKLIKRKVR
ncbi:MAG: hypothetical protein Q4C33_01475 [bacterium]|nr:hypothetical protein [bacterium]